MKTKFFTPKAEYWTIPLYCKHKSEMFEFEMQISSEYRFKYTEKLIENFLHIVRISLFLHKSDI